MHLLPNVDSLPSFVHGHGRLVWEMVVREMASYNQIDLLPRECGPVESSVPPGIPLEY